MEIYFLAPARVDRAVLQRFQSCPRGRSRPKFDRVSQTIGFPCSRFEIKMTFPLTRGIFRGAGTSVTVKYLCDLRGLLHRPERDSSNGRKAEGKPGHGAFRVRGKL